MFHIFCFAKNKLFEQYGVEFHVYTGAFSKMHDHEGYWELFLMTDGSALHFFRNEFKLIKTNYIQLMRPADVHYFKNNSNEPCSHISISFDKNVIKNLCDIIDVELYKKLTTFQGSICAEINDWERIEIEQKISCLPPMPERENSYVSTELKFIFFKLLHRLCTNIFKEKKSYPLIVREAINLMQSKYADYLTIADICQNLGCTHVSLLRQFKQHTGKTVINYFTDLKLEKAFTLLISTHYKVLDICGMVGIDSISYFNKKFKEKYGFTPTKIKYNRQ